MISLNQITLKPDDTFLIGYPRSGNHLVTFLTGSLYFNVKITWSNCEKYIPQLYHHTDQELQEFSPPRFIFAHNSFYANPHPIGIPIERLIYIVRDVRDVIISQYYYRRKRDENFQDSFDVFFDKFVSKRWPNNPRYFTYWDEHIKGWLYAMENRIPKSLLLRYEDILDSPHRESKRICRFLDIDYDNEKIDDVVEWCSFDNMKKLEICEKYLEDSARNIPFCRKGEYGQWKDVLTKQQQEEIWSVFGEALRLAGYNKEGKYKGFCNNNG